MKKIFVILLAVSAMVAVSCQKPAADNTNNGNTTPSGDQQSQVDLTALNALIAECETLVNGATTDSFPQKAIDDFKQVIATVKQASAAATTQSAVDNLLAQLTTAKQAFLDAELGAIPSTALAWALDFEEGSGASLTTTGQNNWVAKLVAGNDGLPTFVEGHKAGSKGMQFGGGAHLEIDNPVASVLESATFSIACWVNTPINENNYILSWNKWDTWKFQTQSTNKAFLTICADGGAGNVWIDHDGNNEIPENEWHHIVATMNLNTGTMVFYLDGEQTILWNHDNEAKLTSNMAFNPAPAGTVLYVGLQEDGSESYFVGKLDNLRFYSIDLDEGQVAKLFADENK
ncbi:MAG: LamG domain-containing protein [Bacteroidales bacterium]|nr:LamG domain-containing protein [Bacteroidales bacterium]